MPTYFQRPENALKRANEFLDVGKPQRALDALYDVIKSKKHRQWHKIHEPIMEKYLELCVQLKKSHIAKEGLYQYKNICFPVNIKSLEDVVRKYLRNAEEKTEAARVESHQAVVDVDDLDVLQTPENLLLSAVSGEDTQDRTDRAILTPWVKFLWESYRQCLDLLRNNSSFEKLYQDIAQQAFKFCLKYGRKTEFRKLCDNLRTHLGHIHRHQHQQRAINLNNPESQAMHLETRLVQLDSAINMELWQEAFKAVEDIHGLISLSKKPPKPSLMANFYQKLGLVFWKSGNHMFHACAYHRLLHLSREQKKNLSQEELHKLASRVLCATLSIPIPQSRTTVDALVELDDNTLDKQRRLATLLGLSQHPTRAGLVKDLVKYNVVQNVNPELQNLYHWLEVEFHPLKLSSRVMSSLEYIKKRDDLVEYVPALEDITIVRLVKQVSQVYQTIEFDRLVKLTPFTSPFRLERVLVDIAKKLELQLRIDHKTRSLSFGTDLGVSQKEDIPEGPYLQSMPSEQIRNQLTHMASALNKAMKIITPIDLECVRADLREKIVQMYHNNAAKEHMRILHRRIIIEERKEEIENLNVQREQEEYQQLEDQKRRQYEAEMARLEREAEERERQRRLEEHREIQKKVAKERLEQLKSTSVGAKAFADLSEDVIAEMDVEDILAKQVEQLEREKRELQEKLKSQEKKVDYFERAKRLEEIPLLEKQYKEEKELRRQTWEKHEEERIKELEKEREIALQHRDRLRRMQEDKEEFLNKLKEDRKSIYKDKLAKFEERLIQERQLRLEQRKQRRKQERQEKWFREKEEEKQRKRDEELKKQREEEERIAREKREKEEAEYQERLKKLNEIEERKRQREREIEERQKREEMNRHKDVDREHDEGDWRKSDAKHSGDGGSGPRPWRPRPTEGGWRERVKVKQETWEKGPVDRDRDEGGWRDRGSRPPARDDRSPRGSRGPPGEMRSPRSELGPPDDHSPRSDLGDRSPRRNLTPREGRSPREERSPRGDRDDRMSRSDRPPRDDFHGSRDYREPDTWRGSRRDDDREWRGGAREEGRGRDWRAGDGGRERDWRRDDHGRDSWRREPPARDRDDVWRRDGPRRDDKWKDQPPRDDRDTWKRGTSGSRDRDVRKPPVDDDKPIRRGPPRDDIPRRDGPPRDRGGSDWRGTRESRSSPTKPRDSDRGDGPVEDDGWTMVHR